MCINNVFRGFVIDTCIAILQPDPISVNISVADNFCHGSNDGIISLFISQGVAPYDILLDSNESYIKDGQLDIKNLRAGSHQIGLTNARGCQSSIDITIAAAELVMITYESVDNNCKVDNTGVISLNIVGISDNYDIERDRPDQTIHSGISIDNLISGDYTVRINIMTGCSFDYAVSISEPDQALSGTATVSNVIYHGESSGIISISTSDATGELSFVLDNESEVSNPGVYDVELIDGTDCRFKIEGIEIQEPKPFEIILNTDTFTYEMQDVDIALSVDGAQGDYDLFWVSDTADLIPCMGCESLAFYAIESSIIIAVEAIDDAGCVA